MAPTQRPRPSGFLFLACLSLALTTATVAVAIPAPIAVHHPRTPAASARCVVDGEPAALANGSSGGGWDIRYAEVGPDPPLDGSSNYTISDDFANAHHLSDHIMAIGPGDDLYGAFKCQFICNGARGCVSYFGMFENTGPDALNYKCSLFDQLLDSSVFVHNGGTTAVGGYNKLCNGTVAKVKAQ